MRPAAPAVLALALALPAAAAPSEADVARFVQAVVQIGCEVRTDAHADAIEAATGFSEAQLAEIVAVLLQNGRAEVPSSMVGLRLVPEECG